VLVIPTLVTLYGFTYRRRSGRVGDAAAADWDLCVCPYYRSGNSSLAAAGLLALGFAAGAYS
jgi:hypothetical protein